MQTTKWYSVFLIALSLTAGLSSSAFVEEANGNKESGSEFFYQTPGGKQALTPALTYNALKIDYGGPNVSLTQFDLKVSYEYGFNDMFSAGATIGYSTGSQNPSAGPSTSMSGLDNIDIYGRGSYNLGSGALKFGADLSVSPGNATENSSSNPTNWATGGESIIPYVGYQMAVGPGTIGAKYSTQIDLGNRTIAVDGGSNITQTGGDVSEFDLFYEQHLAAEYLLGGALTYTSYSSVNSTPGGTYNPYSPFMGLQVYGSVGLGSGELLPMISYQWTNDKSENGSSPVSSYTKMAAQVAYRMTF